MLFLSSCAGLMKNWQRGSRASLILITFGDGSYLESLGFGDWNVTLFLLTTFDTCSLYSTSAD
jgi:hypothetical protein